MILNDWFVDLSVVPYCRVWFLGNSFISIVCEHEQAVVGQIRQERFKRWRERDRTRHSCVDYDACVWILNTYKSMLQ